MSDDNKDPVENPAVSTHTNIPPAVVEAIAADPKALQPIARAMGAVNLHNLFTQMRNPNVAVGQRMEFQRLLNDLGRLTVKDDPMSGAMNMPTVKITLGAVTATISVEQPTEAIDVTPVEVTE